MKRLVILVYLFCPLCFVSFTAAAAEPEWPAPMKKFAYSDKKLKKFFDLDKNGVNNAHETALIMTQKRFGWVLAASKKRKQYDVDGDHMLSSYEYHLYKKGQKNEKARYRPVPIKQGKVL